MKLINKYSNKTNDYRYFFIDDNKNIIKDCTNGYGFKSKLNALNWLNGKEYLLYKDKQEKECKKNKYEIQKEIFEKNYLIYINKKTLNNINFNNLFEIKKEKEFFELYILNNCNEVSLFKLCEKEDELKYSIEDFIKEIEVY